MDPFVRQALAFFAQVLPGPSWGPWRVVLRALLGAPLDGTELALYRHCTGRQYRPQQPVSKLVAICGRRSGKSRFISALLVLLACFRKWPLALGEKGVVLVVAPSRAQGQIVLGYCRALIDDTPALQQLIVRQTQEQIELSNNVSVQIGTASLRAPRGYSVVACVIDESAYLDQGDSANPDREILRAIEPAVVNVHGLIALISTPYAAQGELHRLFEQHYGKDDDHVLVWRAASRTMNPTIAQATVDRALRDDPEAAAAEWDAQFRSDLQSLFSRAALEACVVHGRHELPRVAGVAYTGFIDPSGGSADSFTLAIAHRDVMGRPVLDLVREVHPPFSPEQVVEHFAQDLQRYGLAMVTSDRYAGEWPREAFARHHIDVQPSALSASELYLELLPLLNSQGVELLDDPRLIGQLAGLQRRVGRSGRDAIEHRSGSHDDRSNAVAGAVVYAARSAGHLAVWPETFNHCRKEADQPLPCVLLGGHREYSDPICHLCPGRVIAKSAYRAYIQALAQAARPEPPLPFGRFVQSHFAPNDFVGRRIEARFLQAAGWA